MWTTDKEKEKTVLLKQAQMVESLEQERVVRKFAENVSRKFEKG